MSNTKEEIIGKYEPNREYPMYYNETQIELMMDEWAKEQMKTLIRNIAANPVSVYSQKARGQEKQYFLGRNYVEDLIKRIQ